MIKREELRKLELEIAKEIKRICEKNTIEYFITDGTLLGAVRHGGFIPWDDDMDIGMTTDNYMKFISVAQTSLDERFLLQTEDTDSSYGNPFAKVRLRKSHFKEKLTDEILENDGIFVDVFPYDFTSEKIANSKPYLRKMQLLGKMKMLKAGYDLNSITSSVPKKAFNSIIKLLPISREKVNCIFMKEIEKAERAGHEWLVERDGIFKGDYAVPAKYFSEYVDIKFEDTEFKAPKMYHDFLRSIYGDYNVLPSESARIVGHNVKDVELELPYEKYFI